MRAGKTASTAGRALAVAVWLALALARPGEARAGDTLIAVAANFAETMPALEAAFEQRSGHELRYATGATGKLYAQIHQHAPFDVFLAADQRRPERLVAEGLAVPASRFTYARGRLVLWSKAADRVGDDGAATLRARPPRRLVLANPAVAPYGAAARQTLEALGLWRDLEPRLVMAQNVGQAYAMAALGAAEMGLIPLAAVGAGQSAPGGSLWRVPADLHEPIRQDAVLLERAADNEAARAFIDFLASPRGRSIIADHGYDLE